MANSFKLSGQYAFQLNGGAYGSGLVLNPGSYSTNISTLSFANNVENVLMLSYCNINRLDFPQLTIGGSLRLMTLANGAYADLERLTDGTYRIGCYYSNGDLANTTGESDWDGTSLSSDTYDFYNYGITLYELNNNVVIGTYRIYQYKSGFIKPQGTLNRASYLDNWFNNQYEEPPTDVIGTGGGATHIAKVTGLLSTLENNLSDVLIVAGGGGGGLVSDGTPTTGANAGGISGSGNNSANQSTGYAFGQGEANGGGGGLYGGYKAAIGDSGGAGSGYIGNALLDAKKMVGYNVPTSDTASTKTESVDISNPAPTANTPKAGNGFAKITWLRDLA